MNTYEVQISKVVVLHVNAKDEFEAKYIVTHTEETDVALDEEMICVDVLGCIEENIEEDCHG